MLRLVSALVCALLLLAAPAAADDVPAGTALGHACRASDGVRFCPTAGLADRVRSFDGVPLDVDVTLPAEGEGPFPTVLLLHGLGGTKASFRDPAGRRAYSDVALARRGYAVVMPTARGYGRSCGRPETRTAGCERGWTHMADIRYEVRDLQHLVGLLVDEGVADPRAIASTGVSYGGGMSTMLAFLRDRVMTPAGALRRWRSPKGTAIRLAAAWPRWQWSNGEAIFTRTGRDPWTRTPPGVIAQSYAGGIFAVPALAAFRAPVGADPSADLIRWKQLLDRGRFGAATDAVLDNAFAHHGVAALKGRPAPLLIEQGWTDALFPAGQAFAAYDAALARGGWAALQLGDLGHAPATNRRSEQRAFDAQGLSFLRARLRGRSGGPARGAVTAYRMTCGRGARAHHASRLSRLATGRFVFHADETFALTGQTGDREQARRLDPLAADACATFPATAGGAALSIRTRGLTLLGRPVVRARVVTRGRYGQIAARLWDTDPDTGRRRLITRGVYRLATNQRGPIRFTLDGNGWRFAAGHRITLELLGQDAPTYAPSPEAFSVRLSAVEVRLPTRD